MDSRVLLQLDRYAGCRHQRRQARRMLRAERADPARRQALVLPLASLLVALPLTAIVAKGYSSGAGIVLMALAWVIIGIINVVYIARKPPPQ